MTMAFFFRFFFATNGAPYNLPFVSQKVELNTVETSSAQFIFLSTYILALTLYKKPAHVFMQPTVPPVLQVTNHDAR